MACNPPSLESVLGVMAAQLPRSFPPRAVIPEPDQETMIVARLPRIHGKRRIGLTAFAVVVAGAAGFFALQFALLFVAFRLRRAGGRLGVVLNREQGANPMGQTFHGLIVQVDVGDLHGLAGGADGAASTCRAR